jgi:hypothetical protein
MKYQPLFIEYDFTVAKIKWHNPVLLKENWIEFTSNEKYNHKLIYFYKIIGKRKEKGKENEIIRLLYIGYTGRDVHKRLNEKDHLEKQERIKLENAGYRLYVCAGELESVNPQNRITIKDLETLLIYSHKNTQFDKLINVSNAISHNINRSILIENSGYLRDGMYKKVAYGLFNYE